MLFSDPIQAPNCSIPAAANAFKVCAVMRVNLKNIKKKDLQVGEKIIFWRGGGMI